MNAAAAPAVLAFAIDAWILGGGPMPRIPPRVQWTAEPVWIIVSFAMCAAGLSPLLSAFEFWLGPVQRLERAEEPQFGQITVWALTALAVCHLTGLIFAPTAQRRRLCFLGVAIQWSAVISHRSFARIAETIRARLRVESVPEAGRFHPNSLPTLARHWQRARMAIVPLSRCAICCGPIPRPRWRSLRPLPRLFLQKEMPRPRGRA